MWGDYEHIKQSHREYFDMTISTIWFKLLIQSCSLLLQKKGKYVHINIMFKLTKLDNKLLKLYLHTGHFVLIPILVKYLNMNLK